MFENVLSQPAAKPVLAAALLRKKTYIDELLALFESFIERRDIASGMSAFRVLWSIFRLNDATVIEHMLAEERYLNVARSIDIGLHCLARQEGMAVEAAAAVKAAAAVASQQKGSEDTPATVGGAVGGAVGVGGGGGSGGGGGGGGGGDG